MKMALLLKKWNILEPPTLKLPIMIVLVLRRKKLQGTGAKIWPIKLPGMKMGLKSQKPAMIIVISLKSMKKIMKPFGIVMAKRKVPGANCQIEYDLLIRNQYY